jgi:predicted DNA-binding protein (MmcQ/YjbR family)
MMGKFIDFIVVAKLLLPTQTFLGGVWIRLGSFSYNFSNMMHLDSIREFCLSLPSATENVQWESDLCFKVAGKIFAITGFGPDSGISFKCSAEVFAKLIERDGVIPAPYLARYHWVSVQASTSLSLTELKEHLQRSYDLVVSKLSKKLKESL